eukprot:2443788-Prymnesium_polylepis.1
MEALPKTSLFEFNTKSSPWIASDKPSRETATSAACGRRRHLRRHLRRHCGVIYVAICGVCDMVWAGRAVFRYVPPTGSPLTLPRARAVLLCLLGRG